MTKLVIVEDNLEFGKALQQIVEGIADMEVIECFVDAESAISELPEYLPEIVIVDVQLKGKLSGLDVIEQTKMNLPLTQFLICTVNNDTNVVFDALFIGAAGYILKDSTAIEIKNAIIEVCNGGAPMSPYIAKKVISSFRETRPSTHSLYNSLTNREKEIINLLAKGLQYKEIALELHIAQYTVKKHIRNIYEKLHVQNKIEALNKLR